MYRNKFEHLNQLGDKSSDSGTFVKKNKWAHLSKYSNDSIDESTPLSNGSLDIYPELPETKIETHTLITHFSINKNQIKVKNYNITNETIKTSSFLFFLKKSHVNIKKELNMFFDYIFSGLNKIIHTLFKALKVGFVTFVVGFLIIKVSSSSNPKISSAGISQASASERESTQNSLSYSCKYDKAECLSSLAQRTVKIDGTDNKGRSWTGTGFIYEGDKDYLTVVTASHVVRAGNAKSSQIFSNLFVYNEESTVSESPLYTCAFFQNGYADIAVLKIKNNTNTIFEKIESFDEGYSGQKVFVIDHKNNYKRWSQYTIHSFNSQRNEVVLRESAEHGMSGAPIVLKNGKLIGILTSGNQYVTFGTYRFNEVLSHGIDYLYDRQNYFAPYICN